MTNLSIHKGQRWRLFKENTQQLHIRLFWSYVKTSSSTFQILRE